MKAPIPQKAEEWPLFDLEVCVLEEKSSLTDKTSFEPERKKKIAYFLITFV